MAKKSILKGITVEIGGDATDLGQALDDIGKKTSGLSSSLKGLNSLLKLDPTNTTLLAQKQRELTNAVEATKEKLRLLKETQAQVQAQFDKGEITEEQYQELQREIGATEAKLKSLTEELRKFGTVGAQQAKAVGEAMKKAGGKIEGAGQSLAGVSTAAAAALAGASKTAIDFESAWAGVRKTVDGTDEELEPIRQGILDLSQTTASSATDIAAVAEAAGQLGIERDSILKFTETMVMLGDTTNMSATDAAAALAKFANITQMSADDYSKLGSAVVDLGNNFATTENDIVEMATRLASTGEVTGLSEAQILALATTMSSLGIEAEAGGTAVSKLLKKMYSCNAGFDKAQKAVDSTGMSLRDLQLLQANNSTEFKNLADSLGLTSTELKGYMDNVSQMNQYASAAGVSVEEFRKAYGEDAVGALSLFVAGLNETERNGKSAVEILNEMGLTEVRLSNAILAMASSGDLLNSTVRTANDAWGANNALSTEAEKRYETTASQIQQLKGKLTEMCVVLGETLLPIINSVVDGIGNLVTWFTNLSPTTQNVILAILGLVAVAAPLLITIGKIVSAIGSILTFAPQIATAFGAIKTAFAAVGSAISSVISFVTPLIKGLFALIMAHPFIAIAAAVIGALVLLYNKCEWFRERVDAAVAEIKRVVGLIGNWVVKFVTVTVPAKLAQFGNFIANLVTDVINWFAKLPGKIGSFLGNAIQKVVQFGADMLAKGKKAAGDFFNAVVNGIKGLPDKMLSIGGDIVRGLWAGIKNLGNWFWDNLTGWANSIVSWVKSKFGIASPSKVFAELGGFLDKGLAEGLLDNMDDPIAAAKEMTEGVIKGAQDLDGFKLESDLRQRSVQMAADVTAKADNAMLSKLDKVIAAIENGQVLTLDGKALIGGTATEYDRTLGQRRILIARGAV